MAKRKSNATPARRRKRRSDEELIRDLQEKISQVKQRAAAREMKKSPHVRAAVKALNAIDKALEIAAEEEETLLRHVLADARRPLAEHLDKQGYSVPKAALPRGRRPKDD